VPRRDPEERFAAAVILLQVGGIQVYRARTTHFRTSESHNPTTANLSRLLPRQTDRARYLASAIRFVTRGGLSSAGATALGPRAGSHHYACCDAQCRPRYADAYRATFSRGGSYTRSEEEYHVRISPAYVPGQGHDSELQQEGFKHYDENRRGNQTDERV